MLSIHTMITIYTMYKTLCLTKRLKGYYNGIVYIVNAVSKAPGFGYYSTSSTQSDFEEILDDYDDSEIPLEPVTPVIRKKVTPLGDFSHFYKKILDDDST